jgi:hypothetical protein
VAAGTAVLLGTGADLLPPDAAGDLAPRVAIERLA